MAMTKTTIVWFRNDLRIHDHPALATAVKESDNVVPVFILNKSLLRGKDSSSNRNRFLIECLEDLKASLMLLGANLVIRDGEPEEELVKLAKEVKAESVFYTADFTPFSIKRDKKVKAYLEKSDIIFRSFGGRLAVDSLNSLETKNGKSHKVFTPFWKNWEDISRRPLASKPSKISFPEVKIGSIPNISDITEESDLSPNVVKGGETEGRKKLNNWLKNGIKEYNKQHNDMSHDGTSRLSSYLHFGCISVREIEENLPEGQGAAAFHRQLAWRDFYNYILFKFPGNANQEFQERYRSLKWDENNKRLSAWSGGQTGYPIVDACMRQLNTEGWMHNRGRLIVGSFLTKDLWLDWRSGEAYFWKMLLDGDKPNNNGNWQWIASVGVDPAPVFRRLYNPTLQGERFDPNGDYIRKYVPELINVPDQYLNEPWKMTEDQQKEAKCIVGKDYPEPIVNHAEARIYALDKYRETAS
jgi:deoxyribodipyrimidine photo-lyase